VLTNASGAIVGTTAYDSYGQLLYQSGSKTSALGFTGEYTDAETGFVFLRSRYFDPGSGTFLTRDPAAALTDSPYAYTNGDPLNRTDPRGLYTCRRDPGDTQTHCVNDPVTQVAHSLSYRGTVEDCGTITLLGFGKCILDLALNALPVPSLAVNAIDVYTYFSGDQIPPGGLPGIGSSPGPACIVPIGYGGGCFIHPPPPPPPALCPLPPGVFGPPAPGQVRAAGPPAP
jgi:RHS repeat-associated protein